MAARLTLLLPLFGVVLVLAGCSSRRPGETRAEARLREACGETIEDHAEFSTVARARADERTPNLNVLGDVYGERIASGRHYAVIDDDGYVGTLRAIEPQRNILAVVRSCRDTQSWWASWVDPPSRPTNPDAMWAFGPVIGRFGSARRLLPPSAPADQFGIVRTQPPPWPTIDRWTTQFQFAFDSEPHGFEVRARRCSHDQIVTETRIPVGSEERVVSRTVRPSCLSDD